MQKKNYRASHPLSQIKINKKLSLTKPIFMEPYNFKSIISSLMHFELDLEIKQADQYFIYTNIYTVR